MPITADEVRVSKRADALLQQVESGVVITVGDLAAFILNVGHHNVLAGDYDSECVHTTDVLRVHLLSLPNEADTTRALSRTPR